MSTHGRCPYELESCGTVVAWWRTITGHTFHLCQTCLDTWFDNADDDPALEPIGWGWISSVPTSAYLGAYLSDPRNHRIVADILRREARINPAWLREFIRREHRATRRMVAW